MPFRVNENCTEFGQTMTLGQMDPPLSIAQLNALAVSGLGDWVDSSGRDAPTPPVRLPLSMVEPITTVMLADPVRFGLVGGAGRVFECNGLRYYWDSTAQSLKTLGGLTAAQVAGGGTEMTIRPPRLAETVRMQVAGMLAIAKGFGLSGPCVFAAGLFGVKGVSLDVEDSWIDPHRALGDRDRMLVPEVWHDDLQIADAGRVARSILDVMWQGFGQDRCDYFDEVSGEYRPPRG